MRDKSQASIDVAGETLLTFVEESHAEGLSDREWIDALAMVTAQATELIKENELKDAEDEDREVDG